MKLFSEGPLDARIVLVGESPGKTEEAMGRPFVGGSGVLLDKMLSRGGLSRRDIYLTNLCHTRPPDDEFKWFYKKENLTHLTVGLLTLKSTLERIKPNLVIALGSEPLKMLTGKNGIDKWRGSILPCSLVPGLKVMGTYHPAYVLRVYDYKAVAEMDFRKAKNVSHSPDLGYSTRSYMLDGRWYSSRPHSASVAIDCNITQDQLVEEMYGAPQLSIDIECKKDSSGKWRLSCVGFSDRPERAMVIPYTTSVNRLAVQRLCSSPAEKIFMNGNFDTTVLLDEGIEVTNWGALYVKGEGGQWHLKPVGSDVMLAHHSTYPECAGDEEEKFRGALAGQTKKKQAAIGKSLAFMASIHTNEPYWKDESDTDNDIQYWTYNAKDCAVTLEIAHKQKEELVDWGVEGVFAHEMALCEPLRTMMRRGIKIDQKRRAEMAAEKHLEIERLQKLLDHAAGQSINVKSTKDVQWLMYDKLKLAPKTNRKTGNVTANKDAIIELAEKSGNPTLLTVLEIRKRRDLLERYLETPLDSDGRMRCSFDITGTRGGRLNSRASIYGSGTNLQNQPPFVRESYIPDDGKVFVYPDYSQAEARVVAYLAEEKELIALFNDPLRDVHKENAVRIYGVSLEAVTYEQRYLAKRTIHASNYMQGPFGLMVTINHDSPETGITVDFATAKRVQEAYFMLYPGIQSVFWAQVERELRHSLTLNTPFGRKRMFFGRWDSSGTFLREAVSYIPQSTIGDLCCKALIRCYHEIERVVPGAELLLNVHDSLLMQCWERDALMVAEMMKEAMKIPFQIKGHTVNIPTDCKIGYNWGEAKKDKKTGELKNPRGLVSISEWGKAA